MSKSPFLHTYEMEDGDLIDVLLQQRGGSDRIDISLEEAVSPDAPVDRADEAPAELEVLLSSHILSNRDGPHQQVRRFGNAFLFIPVCPTSSNYSSVQFYPYFSAALRADLRQLLPRGVPCMCGNLQCGRETGRCERCRGEGGIC